MINCKDTSLTWLFPHIVASFPMLPMNFESSFHQLHFCIAILDGAKLFPLYSSLLFPMSLLALSHTGHPFIDEKRTIWINFIKAFLWITWKEMNNRLFNENGSSFDNFFDHITYLTMSWCKCTSFFSSFNLTSLVSCNFVGLGFFPFFCTFPCINEIFSYPKKNNNNKIMFINTTSAY